MPEWDELTERSRFGNKNGEFYAERNFYVNTLDKQLAYNTIPIVPYRTTYPGFNSLYAVSKDVTISGARCEVKVDYGEWPEDRAFPGKQRVEFDTSASQEKRQILPSLIDAPHTSPGEYETIGQDGEGKQLYIPTWQHQVTKWFSTVTNSYIITLFELTGTINRYRWGMFAPRSVLFLGAKGRVAGEGLWRVDFSFIFRPQRKVHVYSNFQYHDTVWVSGWDIVWSEHAPVPVEDGDGNQHRKKIPRNTHVNRGYTSSRYDRLGLGT